MSAGAELKRRREEAGLSQQDVAVALGLGASIISKWERDLHNPSRDNAPAPRRHVHAGGELFAAFGYRAVSASSAGASVPESLSPSPALSQLESDVASLRDELDALVLLQSEQALILARLASWAQAQGASLPGAGLAPAPPSSRKPTDRRR